MTNAVVKLQYRKRYGQAFNRNCRWYWCDRGRRYNTASGTGRPSTVAPKSLENTRLSTLFLKTFAIFGENPASSKKTCFKKPFKMPSTP